MSNKICPLLGKKCIKNECAIYNANLGNCELVGQSLNLFAIRRALEGK